MEDDKRVKLTIRQQISIALLFGGALSGIAIFNVVVEETLGLSNVFPMLFAVGIICYLYVRFLCRNKKKKETFTKNNQNDWKTRYDTK